jgi:hypothetical protein
MLCFALPYTTWEQSEIARFARNDAGESDSTMDRFFHYGCSGAYSWILACG